jgi:glucose/arabinose dehydrogenase
MRFVFFAIIALATAAALYFGLTAPVAAPKHKTYEISVGEVAVARIAGPFSHPWAVTFLTGGNMLVTERGGQLWLIDPTGATAEVSGVPAVKARRQGGLLDVVAARDFAETREIFLTYSEPEGGKSRTAAAVARLSDDGRSLEDLRVVFRQQPAAGATHHYGSRIVEAPDGSLWITLGDRGLSTQAQNQLSHIGKIVRVARDGSVPRDNPFIKGFELNEIWSYGHRNVQGAALDPESGLLWTVEHGAKGGDELNQPKPSKNYGWPIISYGTTYAGTKIGEGTEADGMEQPVHYWDPSIAPSGLMIYSGKLWPEWRGDVFVGALKFKLISRLDRTDDGRIDSEERLFKGWYGRIRDVREGPEGAIWFLTDEAEGALYRITPAN